MSLDASPIDPLDEELDLPFWLRSSYPQHRDPSGFKVASALEDLGYELAPEDSRPGDSAVWTHQLHKFLATQAKLESNQRPSLKSHGLYGPTLPHETRVFELFPGETQEELSGQLHHVNLEFVHESIQDVSFRRGRQTLFGISLTLNKKVSYTAISYVWGPGQFTCAVKVSGHQLSITPTVDTILRHLRKQHTSIYLWIDQICIDQRDLNDKSAQVQLMGRIYSRARNTVIWLGEEPDHGALRALQGLYEATMGRDEDMLEDELEYLRHPANEEPGTFDSLVALFKRPWFQRTWIVQEVILSRDPFLMIGPDTVRWDDFGGYCISICELDIFDESNSDKNAALQTTHQTGLRVAARMYVDRDSHFGLNAIQSLYDWLINTRSAAVSNPLDKVHGVLGLCSTNIVPDYERSKEDLFYQVAADAIKDALEWINNRTQLDTDLGVSQHRLTRILDAVDHDPELSHLPSWVVDWSLPRSTVSLANATSALNIYKAGGFTHEKVFGLRSDSRQLHAKAAFFGKIMELSAVFTDTELTYRDPAQHNASLKEGMSFVNSHDVRNTDSFFSGFCATLVAGKDRSGMNKFPQDYIEILSLLCDETTASRPSVPGQTYTQRRSRGHFTLDHLSKRKPGRMFQNMKRAYKNALLNRRLCWSSEESLGLVPRYAREQDEIWVFPGLAVPFVLRRLRDGTFMLLGVCYVQQLMDGNWIAGREDALENIVIA